jgi:hypothetical protein
MKEEGGRRKEEGGRRKEEETQGFIKAPKNTKGINGGLINAILVITRT